MCLEAFEEIQSRYRDNLSPNSGGSTVQRFATVQRQLGAPAGQSGACWRCGERRRRAAPAPAPPERALSALNRVRVTLHYYWRRHARVRVGLASQYRLGSAASTHEVVVVYRDMRVRDVG
eukprot:2530459-Rhodomonas_salina.1